VWLTGEVSEVDTTTQKEVKGARGDGRAIDDAARLAAGGSIPRWQTAGIAPVSVSEEQVTQSDSRSAEPAARAGVGFVLLYALAYTGIWLALLTPMLVSIALRVRELTPQRATENVSLVLGVGALFALFANPLFGWLSDRTTSRFGMRRPWLVGGVLCGSLALLLVARADSIAMVLLGWCLVQLAFNAVLAAIVAVLPDQVPLAQRGAVAGVLGVCLPLGQVSGTFLVHAAGSSTLLMFMLPAVIGSAAVLSFAFTLNDRQGLPERPGPLRARDIARAYWVDPLRHPDFAWAWLSRFFMVLGTAFLSTYQPYYLIEQLGWSAADVPRGVFVSLLVQTSVIMVVSILSGQLSDSLKRRKIFVLLGASSYALGLCIIGAAGSYPVFLAGMAVTGLGYGVYFAVDLALVTDVLPDRQLHAAKDLGIINIANALPQSVAPAIGAAILALGGGDYLWLFAAAGAIVLVGSFVILPVRSVR
jgi:MFS family permease